MRIIYYLLLYIILSMVFNYLSITAEDDESNVIESLYEITQDENEIPTELEPIEYYREKPINLNETNGNILSQLPGITYITALKIIDLVQNNVMDNLDEIADSLRLDDNQIYVLRECTFMRVDEAPAHNNIYIRSRSVAALNEVKGFWDNAFKGSPVDLYTRLTYISDLLDAGVLFTKDAGEVSYFDFICGYLKLDLSSINLFLGDYSIQTGMGNLLWSNFRNRKGSEVIKSVSEFGGGIKPYRSEYELYGFRGAAVNYKMEPVNTQVQLWYSSKWRHGNLDTATNTISSLYNSENFRTDAEIEKKNKLKETLFGGSLEWQNKSILVGGAGYYLRYTLPVMTESKSTFYGKSGLFSSVYTRAIIGTTSLAAELSRDNRNYLAFKSTFSLQSKQYEIAWHFRYIGSQFRSPFGSNFGENSYLSNEAGLYLGFKWNGTENLKLSAYTDIYRTLGRAFDVPLPIRGIDLFTELNQRINPSTNIILRLRYEDKSDSYNDISHNAIFQKTKSSLRFETQHYASNTLYIRFRFEAARLDFEDYKPVEYGYSGFGEFSCRVFDFMKIGAKATYYSTDSYESAIWQFDYISPGYMLIQPLYDEGVNTYIYTSITPSENLNIWLKYVSKSMNNTSSIGSGYDEIEGNRSSRLFVQIDLKFNY